MCRGRVRDRPGESVATAFDPFSRPRFLPRNLRVRFSGRRDDARLTAVLGNCTRSRVTSVFHCLTRNIQTRVSCRRKWRGGGTIYNGPYNGPSGPNCPYDRHLSDPHATKQPSFILIYSEPGVSSAKLLVFCHGPQTHVSAAAPKTKPVTQ